MDIKKAVITCAGRNQRSLPLQTLVDRNGQPNAALAIILEEAITAGVDEIAVIIDPTDREAYSEAAGELRARVTFIDQIEARGYGHAISCAKEFIDNQPFLLMVGDHLYVSGGAINCASQLVECAQREGCAVSAVMSTHESKLPYYGAIGGHLVGGLKGLYEIEQVLEKPTPTQAEQHLIVPGLRAGHYLCFFGMHVLTPQIMELLSQEIIKAGDRRVHLSDVLNTVARRERYLAFELSGKRYDIGEKYGLLTAQLALALAGRDRELVLSNLVELLAHQHLA